MNRMIRLFALTIVLAGGAHLSSPPAARATLAPAPSPFGNDGVVYCCSTADGSKHCCFLHGCAINDLACWQVG
jgi:hypothetical protein